MYQKIRQISDMVWKSPNEFGKLAVTAWADMPNTNEELGFIIWYTLHHGIWAKKAVKSVIIQLCKTYPRITIPEMVGWIQLPYQRIRSLCLELVNEGQIRQERDRAIVSSKGNCPSILWTV